MAIGDEQARKSGYPMILFGQLLIAGHSTFQIAIQCAAASLVPKRSPHCFELAVGCRSIIEPAQSRAFVGDLEKQRKEIGASGLIVRQLEIAAELSGDFFRSQLGDELVVL